MKIGGMNLKKMICPNCASSISETSTICTHCGYVLKKNRPKDDDEKKANKNETYERPMDSNEKDPYVNYGIIRGPYNKWISIVLCIFLGFLGAHKFYEQKYYMGAFYLFTFGFFGIGIVLDLIQLFQKKKYYYVSMIPFLI